MGSCVHDCIHRVSTWPSYTHAFKGLHILQITFVISLCHIAASDVYVLLRNLSN